MQGCWGAAAPEGVRAELMGSGELAEFASETSVICMDFLSSEGSSVW